MIIITNSAIEIKRGNDVICVIPKCMQFSAISLEYIGRDIEIQGTGGRFISQQESAETQKELRKNYFIIYYKRFFLALPKELCDVPISNGWAPNL